MNWGGPQSTKALGLSAATSSMPRSLSLANPTSCAMRSPAGFNDAPGTAAGEWTDCTQGISHFAEPFGGFPGAVSEELCERIEGPVLQCSPSHVSGAYFQRATGTTFQFAQYRGAAPAMQDLVGGHVDLMFDQPPSSLPHVRDGNINAYAVTAKARLASAPDIPTVHEAGLPGFYITVWSGMWAPKGTPQAVISKLNAAVRDALADKAVQRRLADLGEVSALDQQTPAALAALQKSEIEKWWPIVKCADLRAAAAEY
jgi:hypothetical protein